MQHFDYAFGKTTKGCGNTLFFSLKYSFMLQRLEMQISRLSS